MDNRSYPGYEDEIEIDLIDLFWDLLMRWKPIALCMILCGCLMMPLMYVRSYRNYEAQLAARDELVENIINEIEGGGDTTEEMTGKEPILEDAQRDSVDSLVLSYRQLLDNQKIYNSTVRFRLDPDHMHSVVLYFHLHSDDPGHLTMLRDMYVSRFSNSEVKKEIAAAYDMDDLYEAGQMVSVGGGDAYSTLPESTDVSISATAILTPDTDVKKISSCIRSVIEEYKPQVEKNVGPHSIEMMFTDEREYRDTGLVTERSASEASIASLKNTINTTYAAFTDEQKQAYDYLTAKVDEEYGSGEEAAGGADGTDTQGSKEGAFQMSDDTLEPPAMSIKYFILGMFLGAFVYAGIFFMLRVLKPGINQVSDLTGTMGVKGIGELRSYPGRTAWDKFMVDPFVYNIRYRKRMDVEEGIRTIRERLSLMPEFEGETVFVTPTRLTAWQEDKLNTITGGVESGITIVGERDFDSVRLEEKLADHPRVILVSSAGRTPYRAASKLFGACRSYGASLCGHILIEAVK